MLGCELYPLWLAGSLPHLDCVDDAIPTCDIHAVVDVHDARDGEVRRDGRERDRQLDVGACQWEWGGGGYS